MDVVNGIVKGITTLKEQKISSYIGRYNLNVDDSNKIAWMFIRPLKYSDNLPENSVPVSRNSSLGIKLQKVELGKTFSYVGFDGLKRSFNHTATIYNKSDLVNNTINIYNDDTEYRYNDIYEFFEELRRKEEEIIENEKKQKELEEKRKILLEQEEKEKTKKERELLTKQINQIKNKHRELTLQQDEMIKLSRYIREQGKLRFNPILDKTQVSIKTSHLYDGTTLIIDGGPGTGKTTTMIQRLGYLIDEEALNEDSELSEHKYSLSLANRNKLKDLIAQKKDWIFFSPSELLKDYLSSTMSKENLVDPAPRVYDWNAFRVKMVRDYYLLLDSGFKIKRSNVSLMFSNSNAIDLLMKHYLETLRTLKEKLPAIGNSSYRWAKLALKIGEKLSQTDMFDSVRDYIMLFHNMKGSYADECQQYLNESKKRIEDITLWIQAKIDSNDELKKSIDSIIDKQDGANENVELDAELEDIIGEDGEIRAAQADRIYRTIKSWVRKYAYKQIVSDNKLSESQELLSDLLSPVLGDEEKESVKQIGELLLFEQYAKYTRGIRPNMLSNIPSVYRNFRRQILKAKAEGWNHELLNELIQSSQNKYLHPQEQSLLLGFINNLVKEIKINLPNESVKHHYIEAYEENCRPIIGIDEATDFSGIDIYAMASFSNLDFYSITLCGDIMQRLTTTGINSWDEAMEYLPKPKVMSLRTSYRQSSSLLNLAKKLYFDAMNEEAGYKAKMTATKVPQPLLYVSTNEEDKIKWIVKRIEEVYNAYGKKLPAIAIFLNDKKDIYEFVRMLNDTDFVNDNGIRIVDGSEGNVLSNGDSIRVYPINVVKGMEFDVVFFHNIDKSNIDKDLLSRYVYVGVSRAAFFLGITMENRIQPLSDYLTEGGSWGF